MGEAGDRRDCDPVVRESALRAGRAGASRGRTLRDGGDRGAHGPRPGKSGAPGRVVDGSGRAATFTGEGCHEWAGGRTGEGYAAQGNILVSAATVGALAETFESSAGRALAERLLSCLAAAQAAGGDRRGQQSASLLIVEKDAGYAGLSDVVVDLRVDDHEQPIAELERLYGLHQEIFGVTPPEEWIAVDTGLAEELRRHLAALGHEGELGHAFEDWASAANFEERVDGIERVDPVVLAALRRLSAVAG